MKSYRCRGLGLFVGLLLTSGCQTSSKQPSTAKSPAAETKSQPADDARWQVDAKSMPTEEQSLAKRTTDYADQLKDGGLTQDLQQRDPSQVTFPPSQPKKTVTIPLDDTGAASQPLPPSPRRNETPEPAAIATKLPPRSTPAIETPTNQNQDAHISSLKHAADALNEGPKIVPESADFAMAKPAALSTVDPLEYRLQKRARENPHDIAAQLDLQLYSMLNDEPSPELAAVTLLPHDDREMINALIDGLSDFRSAVREDETMLQAKKIHPLLEMAERLRSQADLAVPTVALCKRVVGFGEYDAITPARFPAGRESKVIVYCEVENFTSKKIDADFWETRLTQQVTLYTDTGQLVWPDKPRAIVDQSHRRRHDFYAYELLRLPPDLTIGRYLLKVTVTDENAGKVAEETVPVSIVATEVTVDQ